MILVILRKDTCLECDDWNGKIILKLKFRKKKNRLEGESGNV